MTDRPSRSVVDLRSSVIVGLFLLTGGILGMIYQRPALLDSAPFMTIATLIVGGSGLGAIVAWLFGGTKTGSEVMSANAEALAAATPIAPALPPGSTTTTSTTVPMAE